jgi:hypothetical protein
MKFKIEISDNDLKRCPDLDIIVETSDDQEARDKAWEYCIRISIMKDYFWEIIEEIKEIGMDANAFAIVCIPVRVDLRYLDFVIDEERLKTDSDYVLEVKGKIKDKAEDYYAEGHAGAYYIQDSDVAELLD